jgi:hypothetical protein
MSQVFLKTLGNSLSTRSLAEGEYFPSVKLPPQDGIQIGTWIVVSHRGILVFQRAAAALRALAFPSFRAHVGCGSLPHPPRRDVRRPGFLGN